MKKSMVVKWKNRSGKKTATYVVAHAKWQKSRGRRPSESYCREKNPQKALDLAHRELQVLEPMAGAYINHFVNYMIIVSQLTDHKVTTTFNGIRFTVTSHSRSSLILAYIHRQFEKRAEEWRNSPEGKAFLKRKREKLNEMRYLHFDLMLELEGLNFSNLSVVINWLSRYQNPSDYIDVETAWREVAFKFFKHGYFPNVNCEEDFKKGSKENSACWLIGQALSGLRSKVHAIHQIFPKFAEEWNNRFNVPQPQIT